MDTQSDTQPDTQSDTRKVILDAYINHLLERGRQPASVFRFCKDLNLEEKEFFSQFASFDAVEGAYWEGVLDGVIRAVESGEEYASFSARQRFLAFGYAFLERSLEIRSLMLTRLEPAGLLSRPPFLEPFERRFKQYAKAIVEHGQEHQEIASRGRVSDLYPQGLYLVFRSVIAFHLKDQSQGFERSDAYLEKSVNFAFDLLRTQPLDSAFDLARFLIPSPSK